MNSDPKNKERQLVGILRDICKINKYRMTTSFTDWIIDISDEKDAYARIFGYDFGVNSSSSSEISHDKAATSNILRSAGIMHIPHDLVFRPDFLKYSDQKSTFGYAVDIFNKYNKQVVCKSNRGTGGNNVFLARDINALENAMLKIFQIHYACAVSPYMEIQKEIRVIMVDGDACAIFSKNRPAVRGDGVNSIANLISIQLPYLVSSLKNMDIPLKELESIPNNGENVIVNWRHNLGQGSRPSFDVENNLIDRSIVIAQNTINAIRLSAASVDIVLVNNDLYVLEVNNGIMMENLAQSGQEGYNLAKSTYEKLLTCALNQSRRKR